MKALLAFLFMVSAEAANFEDPNDMHYDLPSRTLTSPCPET